MLFKGEFNLIIYDPLPFNKVACGVVFITFFTNNLNFIGDPSISLFYHVSISLK